MKLHAVLSLIVLAGFVQTGYSCCRRDDQPQRSTLRERIGIIREALRQVSCNRAPVCPLPAANSCDSQNEPVCPPKPIQCAPVCPPKPPVCATTPCAPQCQCNRCIKPTTCPPIPAKPCSCQERTPSCPLVPIKPCVCHQAPVCNTTPKPCVEKAPLCVPIPIRVPQCQPNTPVCPIHVNKPCDCQQVPVCATTPKPCVEKAPVCLPIPVCPIHVEKPCDCVKPTTCAPVTQKSCVPCQTVTEKKPCGCQQPCHHMVIPIANVSNIFANSMFLGIPCKPHAPECVKTTTTTTTCPPPPEPNCYVCVPCKGKQCTEITNKIKTHVTCGKEPCMVCEE